MNTLQTEPWHYEAVKKLVQDKRPVIQNTEAREQQNIMIIKNKLGIKDKDHKVIAMGKIGKEASTWHAEADIEGNKKSMEINKNLFPGTKNITNRMINIL